jgi:hypothetical protein
LLQFRYWLAVWSGPSEKPAKAQPDANGKRWCAAFLEDDLNEWGGACARKPKPKHRGRYRHGQCAHRLRKTQCKVCSPKRFCQHGRQGAQCKNCGTGRCQHGRRKVGQCKAWGVFLLVKQNLSQPFRPQSFLTHAGCHDTSRSAVPAATLRVY